VAGAVVGVFSLAEYFTGNSYYPEYGYSRAAGTFEHWNQLGGYIALVSFLLLSLSLTARNVLLRIAGFAGYVAQLLALLLSLTLGAVLGVIASFLYALVGIFRRSLGRALLGTAVALLLFGTLWLAVPQVGEKFSIADERAEDRVTTYVRGIQLLQANFWWGVGSADEVYQAVLDTPSLGGIQATSAVPHNLFLSISVEKGIFGGVLLLLIVVRVFVLLLRRSRRAYGRYTAIHYGILLGILAFIVQDMTNLLILHSRLGVVFFAMVALDVRLREFGGAEEASPPYSSTTRASTRSSSSSRPDILNTPPSTSPEPSSTNLLPAGG
jgi:O-antigen ligase